MCFKKWPNDIVFMHSSKSGEMEIWPFQSISITTKYLEYYLHVCSCFKGHIVGSQSLLLNVKCAPHALVTPSLWRTPTTMVVGIFRAEARLPVLWSCSWTGGAPRFLCHSPPACGRTRRGLCPRLIRLSGYKLPEQAESCCTFPGTWQRDCLQ